MCMVIHYKNRLNNKFRRNDDLAKTMAFFYSHCNCNCFIFPNLGNSRLRIFLSLGHSENDKKAFIE